MKLFLNIFQIVISVLLIITVLLQEKGVGLSASFCGGGEFFRSKRGIDRIFFIVTIVLSVLFIGSSVASLFIK